MRTLPAPLSVLDARIDHNDSSQSRYSDIRNIPQRSTSTDTSTKPPVKKDESSKGASAAELPAVSTSTIDVNAVPIYKPVGKPITQVNIDQGP